MRDLAIAVSLRRFARLCEEVEVEHSRCTKGSRSTAGRRLMERDTHRNQTDSNVGTSRSVYAGLHGDQWQMADTIKSFHYRLQQRMTCEGTGGGTSETEEERWFRLITEEAAQMRFYSAAMHGIATRFWGSHEDKPEEQETDIADGCPAADTEALFSNALSGGVKRQREVEGVIGDVGSGQSATCSRYNDRIKYSLSCVSEYFLGVCRPSPLVTLQDPNGSSGQEVGAMVPCSAVVGVVYYAKLPLLASSLLKGWRRNFYTSHGRQACPYEVEAEAYRSLSASGRPVGEGTTITSLCPLGTCGIVHTATAQGQAVNYMSMSREKLRHRLSFKCQHTRLCGQQRVSPLLVLDVGSCYGPFIGSTITNGVLQVPLAVTAIDLSPHEGSDVIKADWLAVRFHDGAVDGGECHHNVGEPDCGPTSCGMLLIKRGKEECGPGGGSRDSEGSISLARGAYDAVFFCLLLSFLPHPRLRYRACLHAHLALKEGGLLVIVSMRTQGARRSPWIDEWVTCIEGIGFKRVHKNVMKQIVGLSFSKQSANGDSSANSAPDDAEAWVERMMRHPDALSGLRTIADDSHGGTTGA